MGCHTWHYTKSAKTDVEVARDALLHELKKSVSEEHIQEYREVCDYVTEEDLQHSIAFTKRVMLFVEKKIFSDDTVMELYLDMCVKELAIYSRETKLIYYNHVDGWWFRVKDYPIDVLTNTNEVRAFLKRYGDKANLMGQSIPYIMLRINEFFEKNPGGCIAFG